MFRCCLFLVSFAISLLSYADSSTPSRSISNDLLSHEKAVQLSVIDTYLELHTGPAVATLFFMLWNRGRPFMFTAVELTGFM